MEVVETNLKDQFLQQWNSEMQESNKGKCIRVWRKILERKNILTLFLQIYYNT